jgi:hypothetical protein
MNWIAESGDRKRIDGSTPQLRKEPENQAWFMRRLKREEVPAENPRHSK